MWVSRREFAKLVTASGISVALSRLAAAETPDFVTRETLPGRQRATLAGHGKGRIDGAAKVIGAWARTINSVSAHTQESARSGDPSPT